MTDYDSASLFALLKQKSGLTLTSDKSYLITSRLSPVARDLGFASVEGLLDHLRAAPTERAVRGVVEAMATYESLFFRDMVPFDRLKATILPALLAARAGERSLRILSAACSSGQEPYSIAMLLAEMGPAFAGWRTEIVATDMSDSILQKARAGIYTDFQVKRGLSEERLARHFRKVGDHYEVVPQLKRMIDFRAHNLLDGTMALGRFDVIFCRNVLIYFDAPTKANVLAGLARALAPDGTLFLGSSETMLAASTYFTPSPESRGMFRLAARPAEAVSTLRRSG